MRLGSLFRIGVPSQTATVHSLCAWRRDRLRRDTWNSQDTSSLTDAAYQRTRALETVARTLTDAELEQTIDRNIERGVVLYTELVRRRA